MAIKKTSSQVRRLTVTDVSNMASHTVAEADLGRTTPPEASHDSKRRKLDPSEVIVEVKLRSTSKAARNDPRSRDWASLASMEPDELNEHFSPPLEDESAAGSPTGALPGFESDEDDHDESEYDSGNDEFADFEWLEQIDGIVKSAGKAVAYCNAKLIRRSEIASDFYAELEQPSEETSSLAFDLFDRYGRLKPQFREHSVMRGTGVFQDEFDNGDLLLFESVRVDKTCRRRGLASKLVTAIIEKVRPKTRDFFAVAAPGSLTVEVDRQVPPPSGWERDWTEDVRAAYEKDSQVIRDQDVDISTALFRKLGFRRVGSSSWFAFASDATHASHAIPVNEDYEWSEGQGGGRLFEFYPVSDENNLHTIADNKLLEMVSSCLSGVSADDPSWRATDHRGNSILHHAAVSSKVATIEWLLKHYPDLRDQHNMAGQTALDYLEAKLEESRTQLQHGMMIVHVSDRFQGYSAESVACLALLRNITPSATQKLRLKFGCTCSKCLRGFTSPRMQFMLKNAADLQHDMMGFDLNLDARRDFVEEHTGALQFMPPAVRQNLRTNKSMRTGVANLFGHFAACLRRTGRSPDGLAAALPSPTHVLEVMQGAQEWPPCSRNYLDRGGNVYAVGSAIFWFAMQQDEIVGDGSFVDLCLDASIEDGGGLRAEYMNLPKCRNDLEYGFVASMLGYKTSNSTR
ncbi:hypothetical protein N0V95_001623 [Ascochyta clinopodiicola]|nr:hypothetical protein N0V95_001623 [Ascochyta clinopodiicola]